MNKITIFKHGIKASCLVFLLLSAVQVKAQMKMPGMQHKSAAEQHSIYLQMMDSMMVKMDKIPAASSAETDFIYQMIPHHEGAIDMANYEILHGKNPEMIQLAKSILAEQSIEIQQMHLWLKTPGKKIAEPASYKKEMDETMTAMMENMPGNAQLKDIDRGFARVMIPHHQAAIDMARVMLKYAAQPALLAYGKSLIASEQIEIEQMRQFVN